MAPCSLPDGPDSGSPGGRGAPAAQALQAEKLEIQAFPFQCWFYCSKKAAEQLQDLLKSLGYNSSFDPWSGIYDLQCYFPPVGGPCEFLAAVLPVLLRGGLRLAAPAVLADAAAEAGGGSPSLQVALQEAWRAKPSDRLFLALLPLAPAPVLGGSAAAAGVVVIWLGEDGFVESVNAPQPLHAEVLQRMPWINPDSWALNYSWHEYGRFSITTLLAVVLPAMTHCGRELVAPQGLVERDRASEGTGPRADATREAEVRTANGGKLPLVFFPRPEQALVEVQWDADEGPPGNIALELKASGADVLTEAPPAARRALEVACPWLGEEGASLLRGVSAEFSPKVHKAVVSSIRQLGYEPVPAAAPAGTCCLFRPAQALREEERQAQAAALAEAEAVAQQAEEQQQALRAELAGAMNALEEERAAREALEADAEQAALQAEEQQRALRAELEEASRALEAQKADGLAHETALLAQAEQAARQAEEQHQVLRAELQEALGAVAAQKASNGAQPALEQHGPTMVTRAADEQSGAAWHGWPSVHMQDVGSRVCGSAKHVRVDCSNAEEVDVSIEDVGSNGVHLHIEVRAGSRESEQDFWFDRFGESLAEPGPDDFKCEQGVLTLVLRQMLPKRMKLKFASPSLPTPTMEEVQSGSRRSAARTPRQYDIASPANGVDSQSVASEAGSWVQVGSDENVEVGLEAELDAALAGKDIHAPPFPVAVAAASEPEAPRTPSSSHGSGAASAASVHSVASAPARGTTPCCFLPETPFRSTQSGKLVRAAELKRGGGERLLGPRGVEVLVRSAIKQQAVERDLVSLRLKGVCSAFVVTADHRLLTRGPNGQPIDCTAGDFLHEGCRYLYSGADFHEVERAELFKRSCEVIDISFEGDAVALAWVLPRRLRSSEAKVPVAVPGKKPTLGDHGLYERSTFLDVADGDATVAQGRRSRSAGARPAFGSTWSVGTQGHDDRCPGRCVVCPFHQFHLRGLNGTGACKALPCPEGAGCRMCHALHPEYKRGRSECTDLRANSTA